jgi:hypothetical protein
MKRPLEQDYTSLAAYTRALEEYCDALAQPEQEPVACIWEKNDGYKSLEWDDLDANEIQEIGLKSYTPLYTHPPQRTWVGLTDEEIKAYWSQLWCDINQIKFASNDAPQKETVIFIFAKAIEAKLKEKNHV